MKQLRRWITSLLAIALTASPAFGQDITGTWQGTRVTATQSLRRILQISRESDGRITVALFHLDQTGFDAPTRSHSATFNGKTIEATFGTGDYVLSLDAKGSVLSGTWTGATGARAVLDVSFVRATPATAWRD